VVEKRVCSVSTIGLLILSLVACSRRPTPSAATLPAKLAALQDADLQAAVKDWMSGLRGKTEAEITSEFGTGGKKTAWESAGIKGTKIRYRLGAIWTLEVYFSKDRVVYAILRATSDDKL
jgi:hypothetical protein